MDGKIRYQHFIIKHARASFFFSPSDDFFLQWMADDAMRHFLYVKVFKLLNSTIHCVNWHLVKPFLTRKLIQRTELFQRAVFVSFLKPMKLSSYRCKKNIFPPKSRLSTTKKSFDGLKDHFGYEGQASLYASYRPRYSSAVINALTAQTESKNFAVDVACGSGQLTKVCAM